MVRVRTPANMTGDSRRSATNSCLTPESRSWSRNHSPRWAGIRCRNERAKANGLEPFEYLKDVLTRPPAADTG